MEKQQNTKEKIAKIGGAFFVCILVLTFFSKTIMNILLPSVKVCVPAKGDLAKEISGEGSVAFKLVESVYAPISGKVTEVYVDEGELVSAGQVLCRIDTTELNDTIELEKIELEKNKLNLEGVEADLKSLIYKIDRQKNKIQEELSDKKKEDTGEDLAIKLAKKAVESNKILFKDGLISEKELEESEITLKKLEKEKNDEEQRKDKESKEEKEILQNELEDLMQQKVEKERAYKLQQMILKAGEKKLAKLTQQQDSAGVIRANKAGEILGKGEKEGRINSGEFVSQNQVMMRIGIVDEGFCVTFKVNKDIDFIEKDDQVALKIDNQTDLQGNVDQVRKLVTEQEVEVAFKAQEIVVGSVVKGIFNQDQTSYYNVIPYEALYKDGEGDFVYTAEKIDDALGTAYIVRKRRVFIEEENGEKVAIKDGVDALDWVIVASEKSIRQGERIKVENENEVLGNSEK